MLETHLKSPITQQRLRSGPAAEHIDKFADWLHLNGYTPICIEYRLQALARWTDWMNTMGLSSQAWFRALEDYKSLALKPPKPLRCSVGATKDSVTAASLFIRFLQESGYIPRKAPPPSNGDLWHIVGEFRKWMLEQRGVTESTLDTYEKTLVKLLKALGNDTRAYSTFCGSPQNCEFGYEWIMEHIVETEGERVDVEELYRDLFDECFPEIKFGELMYSPALVLESVDPTAFRIGACEYADGMIEDGLLIDLNGAYYRLAGVTDFSEELDQI